MSLQSAQEQMYSQWARIMSIPGAVMNNWPAMFTFAVVDYGSEMIIRALPRFGGTAGFIEGNIVNGARDVIKMATWDAAKVA